MSTVATGHRVHVTLGNETHPGTVVHTWVTWLLRRRWYVVHLDHLGEITTPARNVTPTTGGAR